MHTSSRVVSLLSFFLAAASFAQARPAASSELDPDQYVAGEPILAYNLAVIPLLTKRPPPYDDYTVLEEATDAKTVDIREMKAGKQVNRLEVKNRDHRPLYLLGGEVVLGGQQDRMIQSDRTIAPDHGVVVDVMCVEHGRWSGAELSFRSSGAVAHPGLRKAALLAQQGDVWSEVARKSAASGVDSATGTYRRVLQDAPTRARIAHYLDDLQARLPKSDRLAGVAVAINGEIEVVDLFDSPKLFAKLERKLLTSYVLAALEKQPVDPEVAARKAKAIRQQDVNAFVNGPPATQYEAKTGKPKNGQVFSDNGKAVHGTFFAPATKE